MSDRKTNSEKGTVLIVVCGVLAALFLVVTAGIIASSLAAQRINHDLDGLRARFAASSALQVSASVLDDFRRRHNSLASPMTYTSDKLDKDELIEFVRGFLSAPTSEGRLSLLNDPRGGSVLASSFSTEYSPVIYAPRQEHCIEQGLTWAGDSQVLDVTGEFPDPETLPEDEIRPLDVEGIWELELAGCGIASRDSTQILPPYAAIVDCAHFKVKFKVGVMKTMGNIIVMVYMPESEILVWRKFRSYQDETMPVDWRWSEAGVQ